VRALERYAPLTGVIFVVLVIAAVIVGGETPMADDPIGEVVDYWDDNKDQAIVSAIIAAISAVFMLWFAGVWRAVLAAAEGAPARLASTAFAGLIVAAVGWLMLIAFTFVAADTVGDVAPEVTQALSALQADLFFPLAVGFSVFLLASGLAMVRGAMLPTWPGWIALALGVLAVTPAGFFAVIAGLAWIAAISVMLFMRGERPAMPGAAGAAMPPPD
jgi:hypothetical protein